MGWLYVPVDRARRSSAFLELWRASWFEPGTDGETGTGRKRGLDDDRWLWPHVARIVEEVAPEVAFFENVPPLVTHGLHVMLADLSRLGLDAEWSCLSADRRLMGRSIGFPLPAVQRRVAEWLSSQPGSPYVPGTVATLGATQERERFWLLAFSRPDLTTSTSGPPSSPEPRSLNPAFDEWLQGWPIGHTEVESSFSPTGRARRLVADPAGTGWHGRGGVVPLVAASAFLGLVRRAQGAEHLGWWTEHDSPVSTIERSASE